ncbi:MAG TPA: ABC transporter permease [Anaeromyxobacter sp.]|nr:ABC transporter permease [Anaeromyxobacter sp.]
MLELPLPRRFWQERTVDTQRTFTTFLVMLLLMALAAALSRGVFLRPTNLLNLVFQNAILGVVSFGQLLVILSAGIDLSVGSVLGLSTVLLMIFQFVGLPAALLVTIAIPALIGAVNGYFVAQRRLPAFVVTLAMMLFVYSLAQVVSGGAGIYSGLNGAPLSPLLVSFNRRGVLGVPLPAVVWLLALAGVAFYLRLRIGHFVFAVGGNERAAALSGAPVITVRFLAYLLASVLASIGGVLAVARVGEGHPAAGQTYLLDSIAAVTIGGASLSGGEGTIIGTLMGVLILGTLNNILNLLNVSPMMQPAVKGIVILLAVYLNGRREQR